MNLYYLCTWCELFFLLIGFTLGILLMLKPQRAIAFQIKFYRLINWDIQPISMAKEVRNTRIIGLLVLVALTVILIYSHYVIEPTA